MSSTLVIERTFDAPIEKVWHAFSDAEMIKKWWGPKTFTAPDIKIDFAVGGTYLFCMRGQAAPGMPVQDYWTTGTFTEIIPMKKIISTQNFADAEGNKISPNDVGMPGDWPKEMTLTMEFEDLGDKTKLTLTHVGHPTIMLENATMGWNQSLDKVASALN